MSALRSLRFAPYIAGVVAIWLVSSMERPPVPEQLVFWNSDKLLHLLAYAVLACLALIAVHRLRRGALWAFLMSAVYGVVDEVHQSFVPGRSASGLDLIADALGAALVAVAWLIATRARRRAQP